MARPRGNKWQADAFHGGKRVRRSFDTEQAALEWEQRVAQADARGGPLPTADGNVVGPEFTLGAFSSEHFGFLWGSNRSASKTALTLEQIKTALGADTPLASIDYRMLSEYASSLQKDNKANATINRRMAVLSKLLRHAHKLGVISSMPEIPRFREAVGRIRYFTKAEEQMILDRFEHLGLMRSYHLTRFLLYTGFRRGEALSVERRDVDWSHNVITLWATKADHPRTIPLTDPVREAVRFYENVNTSGGPYLIDLPHPTYTKHWERIRHDLGYDDDPQFVPHTLRHTCASRLVQAGIDLRRVQTYMGHKSITTTLRYAHLAPRDLDVAAQALVS